MDLQREVLEQDYAAHVEAAAESEADLSAQALQQAALEALSPNQSINHAQPPFGYGAPIKVIMKTGEIDAQGHLTLDRWLPGGVTVKAFAEDQKGGERYLRSYFIPYENIQHIQYTSPYPAAPSLGDLTSTELASLDMSRPSGTAVN